MNKQSQRYYAHKKQIILEKTGGACTVCGYRKNLAALVFHHTDPATKCFQLTNQALAYRAWDSIQNELAKCVLLCQNCHHELHHPQGEWESVSDEGVDFTRPKRRVTFCCDCGCEVISSYTAFRCPPCNNKIREKAEWPELSDLIEEVATTSLTAVARRLGVTRQAVSARIKRHSSKRKTRTTRKCSLCDQKHYAKGLCQHHYQIHRKETH